MVDLVVLSAVGYGAGAAMSLVFRKKRQVRWWGVGLGLGYAYRFNMKK